MAIRWILIAAFTCTFVASGFAVDEPDILGGLFRDIKIVQKESAEAKKVRLEWISTERTRVRVELTKYENELTELQQIVPDPIRSRALPAAATRAREIEKVTFNKWVENNDQTLRFAVLRGSGINALLRVIGPIAHYRKLRTNSADPTNILVSLRENLKESDIKHFRLNPATSSGSQVEIRLNQLPLELEWPMVVRQSWKDEMVSIGKTRDAFVERLSSGDGVSHLDQADLLDESLKLLQAKIQKEISTTFKNPNIDVKKRLQTQQDMKFAIRDLERVRANVQRLKKVPDDYKVHRFNGGTIEDFLDFCFTRGMIFQEARPADEEYYRDVYRRMQDYAKDVQFVEDWKSDIERRVSDLNTEDQKLIWHAAEK